MKLFTRLAVMFCISTVLPIVLMYLTLTGRTDFNTDIFILVGAGFVLLS